MRKLVIAFLVVVFLFALLVGERHRILLSFIGTGEPPPLLDAVDEGSQATWFDDYFIVVPIDGNTYAIGEPRYAQQNFSYLIAGEQGAILFDAGPGVRDIRPVVESLTQLPVTFVPSHFHYDHIGNDVTFERVAVIDLPHIRERAPENRLTLTWQEHVGAGEGFDIPTLTVSRWLQQNELIDLGGRVLKVLYTPGHTPDSVSLLDPAAGILFSGDFLYPGPLYAFLANSNLGDYLQAADLVLTNVREDVRILGAHRVEAPGAPQLRAGDVHDLRKTLVAIRNGQRSAPLSYPQTFAVNERLVLLVEPNPLQNWNPTYPSRP
ncbi:MAG: MBL fold metallo-hydrolase [Pseudomonadota bacterium]